MTNIIFWNGSSGRAAETRQLRNLLSEFPLRWIELSRDVELVETLQHEIAKGCETVIAAGGDGTLNAIVNALMQIEDECRPALAVIPLGTANDFAGSLHIPDDLIEATRIFREDSPIPVDVVRIRGNGFERYYANVAAGGNCVRVSEELTSELKERWGAFSYLRGAVGVLADMKSFTITLDIDGEKIEYLDSWAVLVANGRTNAGHIEIAPLASPTDGLLDIVIIKDGDVIDMVEIVSGNLTGKFLECEQIVFRQASRLKLHSDPPMRFTLDGEVVDEEPLEFEAIPGAIRMFVGTNFRKYS